MTAEVSGYYDALGRYVVENAIIEIVCTDGVVRVRPDGIAAPVREANHPLTDIYCTVQVVSERCDIRGNIVVIFDAFSNLRRWLTERLDGSIGQLQFPGDNECGYGWQQAIMTLKAVEGEIEVDVRIERPSIGRFQEGVSAGLFHNELIMTAHTVMRVSTGYITETISQLGAFIRFVSSVASDASRSSD